MFFVIPELPSKTFVVFLKKLPGHFKESFRKYDNIDDENFIKEKFNFSSLKIHSLSYAYLLSNL